MIGDVYEVRAKVTIVFRGTVADAVEDAALADGTGVASIREGLRDLLGDELEGAADLALGVTATIKPVPPPRPSPGRHRQPALFDI